MKRFLEILFSYFFFLVFFFLPTDFSNQLQQKITKFCFGNLIKTIEGFLNLPSFKTVTFTSDTYSLLILLILLFLIAVIISVVLFILKIKTERMLKIFRTFLVYYLIICLFRYGFSKIFLFQFYQPESNILFTRFGNLSKDILYWSTIGVSPFYQITLGLIEVFAAILLLFRKSRIVGLLVSLGIFTNVLLVNFGFDISVKLYSILLFSATLFLLLPSFKSLYYFLILDKNVKLKTDWFQLKNSKLSNSLKVIIVGLLLIQIVYPFIFQNTIKSEMANLKGAYKVIDFAEADSFSSHQPTIKFIFFHSEGFIIFQDSDENTTDFYIEDFRENEKFTIVDYQNNRKEILYNFNKNDSILSLQFLDISNKKIIAKQVDLIKMEALKNNIHFMLDTFGKTDKPKN